MKNKLKPNLNIVFELVQSYFLTTFPFNDVLIYFPGQGFSLHSLLLKRRSFAADYVHRPIVSMKQNN